MRESNHCGVNQSPYRPYVDMGIGHEPWSAACVVRWIRRNWHVWLVYSAFLALLAFMCCHAWGQADFKVHCSPSSTTADCATKAWITSGTLKPLAKPLKCGKYQHVYHWPGRCGPTPCDDTTCLSICTPPPPDRCIDDEHVLTEKEYQDLLTRLKKLEDFVHCYESGCALFDK